MAASDKDAAGERPDERGVDVRLLNRIMGAQNLFFTLPTGTGIAEFYATLLTSIPGVQACRVCFADSSAQEGPWGKGGCSECALAGAPDAKGPTIPRHFSCGLTGLGGYHVIAVETIGYRFGFFALRLEPSELLGPYKTFIGNLSNVAALASESRMQKGQLREARRVLERRVRERTEELQHANTQLKKEIEERAAAERRLADSEEQYRFLNQELEQRVAERTAQLEEANRELEAFAYTVSHDLRAPLRHIDGFLGLLQRHLGASLDARGLHHMENISRAAEHMGELIDDLLAFSRMGRAEMARAGVDLGPLVEEVVRELAPEAAGRDVRWQIAALPVVTGDRATLRVVLVNLLANALKFTRTRKRAEIEVGWNPGGRGEVAVFVRDNGVGFDPAHAGKLFGVFQRLHHAEEFEGTGIGLASVHRIVARHGGRTWAEGVVGEGATFYFVLKRDPGEG